jgi:hypothetical protein
MTSSRIEGSPTRRGITRLGVLLLAVAAPLSSQERSTWERRSAPTEVGPTVFHATQALNLPTAVTAGAGEFLFEISHRFVPAISADGTFLGLDGPVRYRLGLAYGITDRLMLGLTRSNLDDNLDLGARIRVLEGTAPLPIQVAVAGGMAWNKEVGGLAGSSTQYHGALIVNAGLGGRVALGVVPAVVANPLVRVDGEDALVSVGLLGQIYLTEMLSLLGEWTLTDESESLPYDPVSFSVEFETGGHFFRVGVTNSLRLNPSQYLAGAAQEFTGDELRLAFNISRVLAF